MKILETDFEGLFIIELEIYEDNRGFFVERFNQAEFHKHGIMNDFPQDNHSRSKPLVLRGMHMQDDPPQAKLVGVSRGSILDVVVDLRVNSKTFGKSFSIELSDTNGKLLFIPDGFIHGFLVTSDIDTDVLYKVDAHFNPKSYIAIKWDDPELNINWPVKNPIVSERDNMAMSFNEYKNKYLG